MHVNTKGNIRKAKILEVMSVYCSTLSYCTFCLSGVGMTVPSFIEMYVSLLRLGLEQVD